MIIFTSETRISCLDLIVAKAMKEIERLPATHPHAELWQRIAENAMTQLARLQGAV